MKKHIIYWIIILLWINPLWAQEEGEYEIGVKAQKIKNLNHTTCDDSHLTITAVFADNTQKEISRHYLDGIGEGGTKSFATDVYSFSLSFTKRIIRLDFYCLRRIEKGKKNRCRNQNSGTRSLAISSGSYPCYSKLGIVKGDSGEGLLAGFEAKYDIYIKPKSIKLYYFDIRGILQTSSARMYLTDKKDIMLKATTGFPSSVYNWQYRIGTSGVWKTVPSSFGSGSIISFSGTDLLTATEFENAASQKQYVYIKITGCTESNIISLPVKLYAPKIIKVETTVPSCTGKQDGKLKIYLDRSLLAGEKLDIAVNKGPSVRAQNGESEVELTGLSEGSDVLKFVKMTYPDNYNGVFQDPVDHERDFTVGKPTDPYLQSVATQSVKCHGGEDGQINFLANGGRGNLYLLYSATDSVSVVRGEASTIKELSATTFSVRLHGENGCTAKESGVEKTWQLTVGEPAAKVAVQQKELTQPTGYGLYNGRIEVISTGGKNGYSYEWWKDGGKISGVSGSVNATLGAGRYGIYAKDGNYGAASPATEVNTAGCTDYVEIEMGQPDKLEASVSEIVAIDCKGHTTGTLKAGTVGGVPPIVGYQWQKYNGADWQNIAHTSVEADGLGVGTYRVVVRDKNDNEAISAAYGLGEPTALSVVFAHTLPTCYGLQDGEVRATASGGTPEYSYQWLRTPVNGAEITGGQGDYTVRVTDRNGCVVDAYFLLDEPPLLIADYSTTLPTTPEATDGSVLIAPSGGTPYADGSYRYQWEYAGATVNPLTGLPADSIPYRVTVRDANLCEVKVEARIVYPLGVDIVVIDSISCAGFVDGRLKAVAYGGVSRRYSYQWYRITENGIEELVEGDSVASPLISSGQYRVKVTDSENNTANSDVDFHEPNPLLFTFDVRHLLCKYDRDGQITVLPEGGTTPYRYQWGHGVGTVVVQDLEEGTYSVKLTDRRGCFVEKSTAVISPDELLPELHYTAPLAYNYSDGSVWVTAEGGVLPYRYAWTDKRDTLFRVDSIPAGIHEVTMTDKNGCHKTLSVDVPNPPLLETFIAQTQVISCKGRSDAALMASAKGGVGTVYRFTWYVVQDGRGRKIGEGNRINGLPAGMYRLKVTDENNVDAWATDFKLSEPDYLTVRVLANEIACNGDREGWVEADVKGGTEPYAYLWTSGDTTQHVGEMTDGHYLVVVRDAHGCETEGVGEIKVPGGLVISEKLEYPVCYEDANGRILLEASGGVKPYRIEWANGIVGLESSGLKAGTYGVKITDAHGCFRQNEYRLENPERMTVELGEDKTLCRDQCQELQPRVNSEIAAYKWYYNGSLFATGDAVKVTNPGTYRLVTENSQGCQGSDEMVVYKNDVVIAANFAMSADIAMGSVLKLVNTTRPDPEHTEWIIPEIPGLTVLSREDMLAELQLDIPGKYTLGIRSTVGDCEAVLYKTVRVVAQETIGTDNRGSGRMIEEVKIWPNPNDGNFRVGLRLRESGRCLLRLYNLSGGLLKEQYYEGSDAYELSYSESLPTGLYILQVICGREKEAVKFSVK